MVKRILVVEPNADSRWILRTILTSAGYESIEADTGAAGVALAETSRPALILMATQLPDLDGIEATRRVKAIPALRRIPIVAVTPYASSGEEVKAIEAGCDGYVTHPLNSREILAAISKYLP